MLNGRSAHVIVTGNEKGGSGKSTTAIHLIVALMHEGYTVAGIDLDSRQQTLTRFFDARRRFARLLPCPQLEVVMPGRARDLDTRQAQERDALVTSLARLAAGNDFVVVDTPGTDTVLSRTAHALADTLITPINDSLVDLDLLVVTDGPGGDVSAPGHYTEMVWEQRNRRLTGGGTATDWIVMRNRLSPLDARNKRRVNDLLVQAGYRYGFRVLPGFSERVVFRELFQAGLTVLDTGDGAVSAPMSMSHLAARQEVRSLMTSLRLPASTYTAIAV